MIAIRRCQECNKVLEDFEDKYCLDCIEDELQEDIRHYDSDVYSDNKFEYLRNRKC